MDPTDNGDHRIINVFMRLCVLLCDYVRGIVTQAPTPILNNESMAAIDIAGWIREASQAVHGPLYAPFCLEPVSSGRPRCA